LDIPLGTFGFFGGQASGAAMHIGGAGQGTTALTESI
jgi:hypothetical protein